jgi:alpha-L-fucosidase
MEDIAQGERVRSYSIEGLTQDGWRELARGTAIGHKKIDRFPPTEVAQVRVLVHEAAAEPLFRRISLHDTRKK